jgi:hypothetical protein
MMTGHRFASPKAPDPRAPDPRAHERPAERAAAARSDTPAPSPEELAQLKEQMAALQARLDGMKG